jgi:hypothetical protein
MNPISSRRTMLKLAALPALAAAALSLPPAVHAGDRDVFIRGAVESADNTVSLPLYRGTSQGRTVWYMVLDSSDGNDADKRGVNRSDNLINARGTAAVQKVRVVNGVIDFPASVDFTPQRQVVPGPTGFPPALAQPGSVGESGYSPLIELPNGVILNAPQIANASGSADKVVRLDTANRRVVFTMSDGFQGGKAVKYISTEASNPVAAALEGVTYAPALNAAPFLGGAGSRSARVPLAAFVNGQLGLGNPQRQGLNSALLEGADPLNVIARNPKQGGYSPLWDVHLTAWSPAMVAAGRNVRQTDFGQIENLAQSGSVTAPDGSAWGASGFIVNCPVISSD